MPTLDHTIAGARDPQATGRFFSEILGFGEPRQLGPFTMVSIGDRTTIDFIEKAGTIEPIHYAFLVTEAEFDEIFGRIRERDLDYWADPGRNEPGQINRWDGGRGVYFNDPNGHLLEILTRPYGSGGTTSSHAHPLTSS